jgi:hypothetical protein
MIVRVDSVSAEPGVVALGQVDHQQGCATGSSIGRHLGGVGNCLTIPSLTVAGRLAIFLRVAPSAGPEVGTDRPVGSGGAGGGRVTPWRVDK